MAFPDAIGSSVIISLAGRDYEVGPIEARHLGTIANEMRSRARDPRPELMPQLAALPESLALKLYESEMAAYRAAMNIEPHQAIAYAVDTINGFSTLLFLLLEDRYKGQFTRDAVFDALMFLWSEAPAQYGELAHKILLASGRRFFAQAALLAAKTHQDALNKIGTLSFGDSASQSKPEEGDSIPKQSAR